MTPWFVYLIRLGNGALYTGISTDPLRRLREHQGLVPRGARALRGKGPLELVFTETVADRSTASRLEHRIKRLSKADKERLVAGEIPLKSMIEPSTEE